MKEKIEKKLNEKLEYILSKNIEEVSSDEYYILSSVLNEIKNEESKDERLQKQKELTETLVKTLSLKFGE